MAHEDSCYRCSQNHDCNAVYQKIGNSKGPNVVSNVLVAFMLPITVFIATLAVFDHVLARVIAGRNLRIAAAFLLAAAASIICILIVKALNIRLAGAAAERPTTNKIEGVIASKLQQD